MADYSKKVQRLAHPFIQPVNETYTDKDEYGDDIHFVVSELGSAGSLEERLEELRSEDRLLDELEIMRILAMVALALEWTHAHGMLHRNLSSAHVFLDPVTNNYTLSSHANIPFKH